MKKNTTNTTGVSSQNKGLVSALNFNLFGNSSTTGGVATKQTYKQRTGKTRVGAALSSIWGGIASVFTGKTPVTPTADGKAVQVKDENGNVIAQKEIANTNWQNILAGLGILVGGVVGTTQTDSATDPTINADVENEQNIRSGQNTLTIVGIIAALLGLGTWAYFKMKK